MVLLDRVWSASSKQLLHHITIHKHKLLQLNVHPRYPIIITQEAPMPSVQRVMLYNLKNMLNNRTIDDETLAAEKKQYHCLLSRRIVEHDPSLKAFGFWTDDRWLVSVLDNRIAVVDFDGLSTGGETSVDKVQRPTNADVSKCVMQ